MTPPWGSVIRCTVNALQHWNIITSLNWYGERVGKQINPQGLQLMIISLNKVINHWLHNTSGSLKRACFVQINVRKCSNKCVSLQNSLLVYPKISAVAANCWRLELRSDLSCFCVCACKHHYDPDLHRIPVLRPLAFYLIQSLVRIRILTHIRSCVFSSSSPSSNMVAVLGRQRSEARTCVV